MQVERPIAVPLACGRPATGSPVVFSRDSKYFFFPSGSQVRVVSVATGAVTCVLSGHTALVTSVVVNPVNQFQLFTSSRDGTIRLWDFRDGVMLKKISVGHVISAMAISALRPVFFLVLGPAGRRADQSQMLVALHMHKLRKEVLIRCPFCGPLTLSSDGRRLGLLLRSSFLLYDVVERTTERFFHVRPLVSLAFHPHDAVVATGDSAGHLTLWHINNRGALAASPDAVSPGGRFLMSAAVRLRSTVVTRPTKDGAGVEVSNDPTQTRVVSLGAAPHKTDEHWHSSELKGIAFTPGGEMALTVGNEGVLVLWQLATMQRSFLPRLGAHLASVAVSPDGLLFALCTTENAVLAINASTLTLRYEVASLKLGSEPLLTGLVVQPQSGHLVFNSQPGAIQFFDPASQTHVGDVEVVSSNVVYTGDFLGAVHRVERVAFLTLPATAGTPSTPVMITITRRTDPTLRFSDEMALKFWEWNGRAFVQNTCVEMPHGAPVTAIACHPTAPLVVTGSMDCRFKVWERVVTAPEELSLGAAAASAASGKGAGSRVGAAASAVRISWRCRHAGFYRGQPVQDVQFSDDGSLLAVASGNTVTLWDPHSNMLSHVLSYAPPSETITRVAFTPGAPFVVALSSRGMYVWSLLTLAVEWAVEGRFTHLVVDPRTSVFAATTQLLEPAALTDVAPVRRLMRVNPGAALRAAATAAATDPAAANPDEDCSMANALERLCMHPPRMSFNSYVLVFDTRSPAPLAAFKTEGARIDALAFGRPPRSAPGSAATPAGTAGAAPLFFLDSHRDLYSVDVAALSAPPAALAQPDAATAASAGAAAPVKRGSTSRGKQRAAARKASKAAAKGEEPKEDAGETRPADGAKAKKNKRERKRKEPKKGDAPTPAPHPDGDLSAPVAGLARLVAAASPAGSGAASSGPAAPLLSQGSTGFVPAVLSSVQPMLHAPAHTAAPLAPILAGLLAVLLPPAPPAAVPTAHRSGTPRFGESDVAGSPEETRSAAHKNRGTDAEILAEAGPVVGATFAGLAGHVPDSVSFANAASGLATAFRDIFAGLPAAPPPDAVAEVEEPASQPARRPSAKARSVRRGSVGR